MRSTKSKLRVENLESRALLATYVGFNDAPVQVVSDQVGTVDVNVVLNINDPSDSAPETVTLTTGGGTAVPGVDYTPVQQTITATNGPQQVAIPILPGPASLGSRILQVSLSPTPGAPQGQSEYIVITHGTDTTSPSVVKSQALTQGGKVVAFSVQFSKPMAIGPVSNLANYAVAAPDSGVELGTSLEGGFPAFTKNIPLKSVTYDAATDTAYLVPVTPVKPYAFVPANKVKMYIHGIYPFLIESPSSFEATEPPLPPSQLPAPEVNQGISNLTDTSGNPIADPDGTGGSPSPGTFFSPPQVAKAQPRGPV